MASAGGTRARDYLAARGITPETAARFRLGLAPERRDGLKAALIARQIPEAELIETGMLIRPEDGGASYDRFRGRLMFPITDRRGRVVAFGGRALGEARAKYLNSPETPLFHKGAMLYNLAGALSAARLSGEVLVGEGYMDVIALSQAGFEAAVAPLGTALTEDQMTALWRLAPEPVLCFDGDEAGRKAAARAAERALPLLRPGHSLRFVELPAGEDPDSYVRRQGAAAFRQLITRAAALAEVLWRFLTEAGNFDTPERRAGLRQACDRMAKQIADRTVQEYYRQYFSDRLRRAFAPPHREQGRTARRGEPWRAQKFHDRERRLPASAALGRDDRGDPRIRELNLLATPLNHPEAIEHILDELAQLKMSSPDLDRLRDEIIKIGARGAPLDVGVLRNDLSDSALHLLLEDLTTRRVSSLELFARPGAPLEQVVKGWMHTFMLHRRAELRHELEAAQREIDITTEEGFARFLALQDAKVEIDADAEAIGINE